MAGFLQADRKVKKGDSGILDGDGAVTLKYTDVAQCAQDINILPSPSLISNITLKRGTNEAKAFYFGMIMADTHSKDTVLVPYKLDNKQSGHPP